MTELFTTTGEEFYLELIAKELSGEISESEKTNLRQWISQMKGYKVLTSPLLHLYLGMTGFLIK